MIDLREALRYAGVSRPNEEMLQRMQEIARRLEQRINPQKIWRSFPLQTGEGRIELRGAGLTLPGNLSMRMLSGCHTVVLMACTLGAPFETILRTEQVRAMDNALLIDACGSAMIEAVCDQVEKEISNRFPGQFLTDRFSPGYGDLPLEVQGPLLSTLDATRKTGIMLLPSMLMNPSKSVTAVIGIADRPQPAKIRGCGFCSLKETCSLRKGGQRCESTN